MTKRIRSISLSISVVFLACGAAQAAVVYTDPADTHVAGAAELIDLDGDGSIDFQVYYGSAANWGSFVSVGPIQMFAGNAVGSDYAGLYTIGYDGGDLFGPTDTVRLEPSMAIFRSSSGIVQGAWSAIGAERFAGLRLLRDGQYHYGWLRLRNVSGVAGMYLLDYAWETTPGQPIVIGDGLPMVADLDGNGIVDAFDLGILLSEWGACADCAADLNADGIVDAIDLGVLLGHWS